ncbi:MAG: hypothetical protein R3C03_01265 [Pirellulaceae bacterium]
MKSPQRIPFLGTQRNQNPNFDTPAKLWHGGREMGLVATSAQGVDSENQDLNVTILFRTTQHHAQWAITHTATSF